MLKKGLQALLWFEKGILVAGLLGLAMMAFFEVLSRYLFNHSFTWFEEFSRYFCVFLTFLGASLGIRHGTHFSMDFVLTRVGNRTGHTMRICTNAIAAVIFGIVAWLALEHALKLRQFGTTSAAMSLPMFWAYLPIAVFSATMVIRFFLQSIEHLMRLSRNEPLGISEDGPEEGSEP